MGEGAVRAPLPRARRGHRSGPRARLAEAREQRGRRRGAARGSRERARPLRIELAEAEAAAARVREAAHARELEINRRQQQIALDTQQAEMLETRGGELEIERATLEARREPERLRSTSAAAPRSRPTGRATKPPPALARPRRRPRAAPSRRIEAAEQDVERARGEVYAVMNTVTALTAASRRRRAARAGGGNAVSGSRLKPRT